MVVNRPFKLKRLHDVCLLRAPHGIVLVVP